MLEENWSLDTIANAFFLRTIHTDPAGWTRLEEVLEDVYRRLLVINNEFHMPRTEEIFKKALEDAWNLIFARGFLSSTAAQWPV